MSKYAAELEFAGEVAALGARVAMHHYQKNPETKRKADGSYVTEGDWAAEAQMRLRIARTWPEHNILGEEEGLTRAGGGSAVDGAPMWVLDPIDGTHNYMAGIPIWATLVALRVDDASVLGVAHAPALNETYSAALGAGASMNGTSIHVDDVSELGDATLGVAGLEVLDDRSMGTFYRDVLASCYRSRGFGDFWAHLLVARGAIHVAMEPKVCLWDFAALEPIVTEAGGRMTQFSGEPCAHGGSCLSTNGLLHDEILSCAGASSPTVQKRWL
jgi:histidinol-phosphatase